MRGFPEHARPFSVRSGHKSRSFQQGGPAMRAGTGPHHFRSLSSETASRRSVRKSEFESELELKYTRQIRLRRDLAEGGVRDVRVDPPEPNVVKDIEAIGSEHKPHIFTDLKLPGNAQVC